MCEKPEAWRWLRSVVAARTSLELPPGWVRAGGDRTSCGVSGSWEKIRALLGSAHLELHQGMNGCPHVCMGTRGGRCEPSQHQRCRALTRLCLPTQNILGLHGIPRQFFLQVYETLRRIGETRSALAQCLPCSMPPAAAGSRALMLRSTSLVTLGLVSRSLPSTVT